MVIGNYRVIGRWRRLIGFWRAWSHRIRKLMTISMRRDSWLSCIRLSLRNWRSSWKYRKIRGIKLKRSYMWPENQRRLRKLNPTMLTLKLEIWLTQLWRVWRSGCELFLINTLYLYLLIYSFIELLCFYSQICMYWS